MMYRIVSVMATCIHLLSGEVEKRFKQNIMIFVFAAYALRDEHLGVRGKIGLVRSQS